MMWIVLRIASILWFIYALLFLSFATSLKSENQSIITFRTWIYVFIFFAALTIFYLYRQSVIDRRRKINRKLRKSLNHYLRNMQFRISIFDFAEENGVTSRDVQKFIDSIIEHYKGKIDINEKGIIIYSPEYYYETRQKGKRKKKKR